MDENKFRKILREKLQNALNDEEYIVLEHKNLIYKVIVNENLQFEPHNLKNPCRGKDYAFQVDLLIAKKDYELPLIVIETKYEKLTTHHILTYSTKALKHKGIYPYLRYGLVIGGVNHIPKKFFTHNEGFDFAFALDDVNNDEAIDKLIEVIKQEINNAETLLKIIFNNRNKVKSFNTQIIVNFDG
jgi:hypothetical protein